MTIEILSVLRMFLGLTEVLSVLPDVFCNQITACKIRGIRMLSTAKANSAKFLISVAGYPSSKFTVTKFRGCDAISAPYSFDIEFQLSESAESGEKAPELTGENVLGKPCRFELIRDVNGEITGYDGTAVEFKRMLRSKPVYAIRLAPWLQLLSLNVNNRVFQKLTVVDIVKKVIGGAGLETRCAFKYKCGGYAYPKIDFCVQYRESDLNFISRLMEQNGIWYYFDGGGSVVITDTFENFPVSAINVPFVENKGFSETYKRRRDAADAEDYLEPQVDGGDWHLKKAGDAGESDSPGVSSQEYIYADNFGESVYSLTAMSAVIPKSVRLRNRNYRNPEAPPEGVCDGAGEGGAWGSVYEYGGAFKNDEEGKRLAALYMTRLRVENRQTAGKSRCAAFRAGRTAAIEGVGSFLLVSVEHTGGQGEGSGEKEYTYNNSFRCIDSGGRAYAPQLRAEPPVASGLITAPIDALGDELPNIDEMGRYRVKLPFDLSETPEYGATKDIRLSQISGGDGYGVHFPSKKNSEMILGYVDGNPDKPIGLGLLPDANARSVSNSENRTENVIRTWGGNELVMDDEKEKSKIAMRTAAGHELVMNDEAQGEKVTLQTVGGNELVMDDASEGKAVTISTPFIGGSRIKMKILSAASNAIKNVAEKLSLIKLGLPESGGIINEGIGRSELLLDNKERGATLKAWGQEIALKENVNNAECGINLTTSTMLEVEMNDIEREIALRTPRGNSIELSDLKNNIVVSNAPKIRTVYRKLKEKIADVGDAVKKGDWKVLKKEKREKMLKDAKNLLKKAASDIAETANSIVLETDGGKIIIRTSGNDGTIEMDNDKDTITLYNAKGKNKIVLDGKNKSISIDSPGDISINAGGKIKIGAKGDICVSGKSKTVLGAKKNIFVNAQGKTSVEGKSEVKVKGGAIRLN
jgi:type VI secretion system secreted protein VgrG